MSGVPQVTRTGPRSYTPDEPILGGRLVEGRDTGRIGHAAANSDRVLGVALTDGVTPESFTGEPTVVSGRPVLNAAPLPTVVAVADSGIEVPVEYAADAAFGQKLVAAADGKVTPYVAAAAGAAPNAHLIVGKCTEPDGVVVATKPTGLMRTV